MARIVIDGVEFVGNSVDIKNNRISIDGTPQDGLLSGVVEVRVIEGELGSLRSDAAVTCGQVHGDVSAGGSITCQNVGGNVHAGGSVRAGAVTGSITAGGSVRHG